MRAVTVVLLCCATALPVIAQRPIDSAGRQAFQHYRNGQELLQDEQFEKAVTEFRAAIELDPLLTLAHYGLGQSFMALKRYASAVIAFTGCRDAYERIFALRQLDSVASDRRIDDELRELRDTVSAARGGRFKMQGVETQITRLEARIDDLERMRNAAVGRFFVPAELSLALGSARFRSGQLVEAEQDWLAAVAVNPRFGEAHNNLAALYLMSQRKKEAADAVRAAERARFRVNPQLKSDIERLPN